MGIDFDKLVLKEKTMALKQKNYMVNRQRRKKKEIFIVEETEREARIGVGSQLYLKINVSF